MIVNIEPLERSELVLLHHPLVSASLTRQEKSFKGTMYFRVIDIIILIKFSQSKAEQVRKEHFDCNLRH